jgi:LytS/YehU family sensor histidine kinase
LQTQAENAIKHGISKIVEGGKIVISTKKVNEYWIELTILNSGELGYQVDTGIGIENSMVHIYNHGLENAYYL